jgi:AraC family transcriptional activator of mtrCDE
MDALSRLLSLYPMRTALDLHCKVAAPWMIDRAGEPLGKAPYHLVVSGSAWFDAAGKKGEELKAGDVVVFPRGAAHRLYVGDPALATPVRYVDDGGMLQGVANDGAGAATDLLCGQFEFDAAASNPLLVALPEVIVVSTAGREDFSGLLALITMLKAETETIRRRGGRAAVVGLVRVAHPRLAGTGVIDAGPVRAAGRAPPAGCVARHAGRA